MKFSTSSSEYADKRQCYVDCSQIVPSNAMVYSQSLTYGLLAIGARFYGAPIAGQEYGSEFINRYDNPDITEYKFNCHTDMPVASTMYCGDCDRSSSPPISQCAGVPLVKFKSVRNAAVTVVVTAKDMYETKTSLETGQQIQISLCQKTETCTTTDSTKYGGMSTNANDIGEGTYTANVQARKAGIFNLSVVILTPDSSKPGKYISKHIVGSPFKLNATEVVCPLHSVPNEDGSECLCAPGYYQNCEPGAGTDECSCQACDYGMSKSTPGNSLCQLCAAGKVAENTASKLCTFCPGGKEASCEACDCIFCEQGKFRQKQLPFQGDGSPTVVKACEVCPIGFAAIYEGTKTCVLCDGGMEASTDGKACVACQIGKYRSEGSNICSNCPIGYKASFTGSRNCSICPSGKVSGAETGAVECASCKQIPDTLYASPGSSKCNGCVSPLEIRLGSEASGITDCVCPEGKYLSAGTQSTSPVCTNCPDGGNCPQGTMNVTDVLGKPGYWRPDPTVAQFWKCPVSIATADARSYRNWMTCYGGTQSRCAPVFAWREGTVMHGSVSKQIKEALMEPIIGIEETDPLTWNNWLNMSGRPNEKKMTTYDYQYPLANTGVAGMAGSTAYKTPEDAGSDVQIGTIITAYVAQVHLNSTTGNLGDWIQNNYGGKGGVWIDGKFFTTKNLNQFANEKMIKGYMSGPLCAICPKGTGRNGDFKSDAVCEPCPKDMTENNFILFGLFLVILFMVVFFVYGQIKKGAHEVHLEEEHMREHTANKKKEEEGQSDDDDNDDNNDNNDDTNSEFSSVRSVQQSEESKTRRRDKRGSMMEYVKPKTSFSKNTYEKTLVEHQRAQREHGTLSGKLMSHKQVLTGMSRIMMSYLQVVAVARSVPIAWPAAVVDTLDAFAVVSAPSLSLVSIDCALNSEDADSLKSGLNNEAAASAMKPVYGKFIMTMMVPIMATLLPALFWGLFYLFGTCCVQKRSCKKCCKWKETITEEDKSWYNLHDLVSVNKHELKKSVFERFKVTLMVVFFLFYPTIVKGVLSMFSCQKFDTIQYLIADMSVQCWTDEHNTYVVLAAIFFVLYVVGIPAFGCFILHHFLPGVHYDPTLPIGTFNPVAGRAYERKDRAHLLQLKLEASAVYGFMWEGLQQKGLAPFWEWSVIMSRKAAIIAIILLLQNFSPQYQLTIALIVMFGYNLLHVKFHPYDLFYHDRKCIKCVV